MVVTSLYRHLSCAMQESVVISSQVYLVRCRYNLIEEGCSLAKVIAKVRHHCGDGDQARHPPNGGQYREGKITWFELLEPLFEVGV